MIKLFLRNFVRFKLEKMFKKKIINKIGIIINWTRELDYYESFIKEFDRNKIVLVVNDIPTKEIERKNNFSMIVENLKKKNVDYFLFTEIYNKYKFKIIISTGLTCANKITSFLLSLYMLIVLVFFFEIY